MGVVLCAGLICSIVTILLCTPIDAFWNSFAGQLPDKEGFHCINVHLFFLLSGAINTILDFILLVVVRTKFESSNHLSVLINDRLKPIPMVWRLETTRHQKLILTSIFTLGLT